MINFVLICCHKLNLPHSATGTGLGLCSLGVFPTFQSHNFRLKCLYVEPSEGGRGGLK